MAPVPAWTREWRPLAKQLCARIGPQTQSEGDAQTQETLLLRADRVIGQLYGHRFVDSVPQDVKRQTEALATKFRVHSLEDRAQKLLSLSQQCDYQVLKLLLELARTPTKAQDEDVAVDEDDSSRWRQVLQQEQDKQHKQQQMQDRLVEELFEISTNDEWFQAWEDSEDDSDWDMSSADESGAESDAGRSRRAKRPSEVLEETSREDPVMMSLDSRVSGVLARDDEEMENQTYSEEIEDRDAILCRYYSKVDLSGTNMEIDDSVVDRVTCALDARGNVQFTMDRPWLLCSAVVKNAAQSPIRTDVVPQRLIHERTVVSMVFEALDGVESLLFELHPIKPKPAMFSIDFEAKVVRRSQHSQNIAIGHLSPSSLHHILDEFAQASSDIQLLRDFLAFIQQSRSQHEQHRCVTLEGLADSLSKIMWSLSGTIRDVEQQTDSLSSQDEDPNPWSGSAARQPTLLGIFGGLQGTFSLISWVKRTLERCFQDLSGRHWYEVRRAEQAKCVLDSLYRLVEVEYMEGIPVKADTSTAESWSRYDILLHLFIGALSPYLSLLNRMVFDRGHFDTIPLDGELFFTTPALLSVDSSPMRTEKNQSFQDGLLSLAPFEVNNALVPVFLEPVTKLMKEALASRQMKNRFLQHQQHARNESLKPPGPPQPSLCELFMSEMASLGWRNSMTSETTVAEKAASSQLRNVPFSQMLEHCLIAHINAKCRSLNRSLADIFRDKLCLIQHIDALRMFVLMKQQDVFRSFSEALISEMRAHPVAWAVSDRMSMLLQRAIQESATDSFLSPSLRELGDQMFVWIEANQLNVPGGRRKIDIANTSCLNFAFSAQQPLRVLFSANILQKYSRLGVLLVQVKVVESTLVKFKYGLRYRRCYPHIEWEMREPLAEISSMLHYSKSLLNYLTNQLSDERWSKYCHVLETSNSLAEMDAAHEQYLDLLLDNCFLLDKHAAVIQYIVTTFNHILRFVDQLDEFVKAVDRNLVQYFPDNSTCAAMSHTRLLDHPDFRSMHATMDLSSKEFKRQSRFLVVLLTSMQKHGAFPHVSEIVTLLNYNSFYHQEKAPRTQIAGQQQHRPLNRTGSSASIAPPPAPKKSLARSRSMLSS